MVQTPRGHTTASTSHAEFKQHYNTFREATLPHRHVDEAKATSSRLALDLSNTVDPTVSCEGLRWLDSLRHTQPPPPQQVAPSAKAPEKNKLLRLPPEIVRNIFGFCSMRALTYDLQLSCRSLRALARSGVWWDRFILSELVDNDLPVVSPFVVLSSTPETLRGHRQRFWLRHLAEGRWPRVPKLVDLSTCSSLPPMWSNRALASEFVMRTSALRLSHSDCCFLTSSQLLLDEQQPSGSMGSVTSLDVSFSSSHLDGAVLHRLMTVLCPHLAILDISGCSAIADDVAPMLFQQVMATLRELICCATHLSFHGDDWKEMSLPRLTKFVVTQSAAFNDDSLQTIARACPSIETLHMSSCSQMTDAGIVEYFAAVKRLNPTNHAVALLDVSIDDCLQIGDLGITVILCSCPCLTSFSIERSWCTGTFLSNGAIAAPLHLHTLSIVGCLGLLREVMRGVALRNALQKWSHLLSPRSRAFLVANKLGGILAPKKSK
ncbi:Hypothetical protein, putative [Bodo saltans]|uniref:F-box domain-containing protein n=1 Tax=Bodo saltans TaxID=75058 RepID=A0A0S4IWU4_BODSA|nr:Hypothetical protein, putative [Bodo saltans]|eukprot:CUF83468.1 Hypothetical protein, putative [Bodo saltans]